MAGPVAFVGRERELSRLLKALSGDARLVLVTGDAGVGKTRLAGEGIARAVAGGLVVVRGECMPMSATLPLWPVAAALGGLADLEGGAVIEAALAAAPGFVRGEVGRLVPRLGQGDGLERDERGEGWQRARLFSTVAELLGAVARCCGAGVGLVVEDVHWADRATLDCLTFLGWSGRAERVRAVVTCRSDEAPVDAHVAAWLAQVRGAAGMEEITLGPLARPEVARQVAALAGGPVAPGVVDELFARAEGNPFFTEQLVATALAGGEAEGGLQVPVGLPTRLAELLAARASRCAGDARAVLNALAVTGRPLAEDLLAKITGLEPDMVRGGLRELAAARLLADAPGEVHRPRHALLAEAVACGLLPGERVMLHERIALALAGDQALAAEAAGHWRAAGRPAEELTARVTAAGAAERVFGYAEAAAHWQRAIQLAAALPDATSAAEIGLPGLYRRAIDALYLSGDGIQARVLAEEAYRQFAVHPDRLTAAVVHHRAAYYRAIDAPAAALPLMEEALRLFEPTSPSAEHARAWLDYADMQFAAGSHEDRLPALNRALQIAEAADATGLIPVILAVRAGEAFGRGQVEQGLAILQRGWALASASGDGSAVVWLAVAESDALLKLARFQNAAEVALHGLEAARQAGLEAWYGVTVIAGNASEALLALGHTAQAAALIDPLTTRAPDRDHWVVHESRAEIDLLRGDISAAAGRHQRVRVLIGPTADTHHAREYACLGAEVALWAGQPGDALDDVRRVFPLLETPDLTILCSRPLVLGMRACADLAEQARARRDSPAAGAAVAAAEGLVSWVERMAGAPFTEHPWVATIPAERATWDAERTRLGGASDPAVWCRAAKAWQDLGCRHRAGYAWWRQAQAQLDAGRPAAAAAAALRAAAAAADGHAPLLAQVRLLAERARIPLSAPAATPSSQPRAEVPPPYGLTNRELTVLRLVAAGRSNAQIGAELFISRATAAVHVTNILHKLGVTNRVQAAALAERARLLDIQP